MAIKYSTSGWVYQINWNGGTDNVKQYYQGSDLRWARPCDFEIPAVAVCNTYLSRTTYGDPVGTNPGWAITAGSTLTLNRNEYIANSVDNNTFAYHHAFYGDLFKVTYTVPTGYYLVPGTYDYTNNSVITISGDTHLSNPPVYSNLYPVYITAYSSSPGTVSSVYLSSSSSATSGSASGTTFAYNSTVYGFAKIPSYLPTHTGLRSLPRDEWVQVGLASQKTYRIGSGTVSPATTTQGTTGYDFGTIQASWAYFYSVTFNFSQSTVGIDYNTACSSSFFSLSSGATSGSTSGTIVNCGNGYQTAYIYVVMKAGYIPTGSSVTLVSGTAGDAGAIYQIATASISRANVDILLSPTFKEVVKVTINPDGYTKSTIIPTVTTTTSIETKSNMMFQSYTVLAEPHETISISAQGISTSAEPLYFNISGSSNVITGSASTSGTTSQRTYKETCSVTVGTANLNLTISMSDQTTLKSNLSGLQLVTTWASNTTVSYSMLTKSTTLQSAWLANNTLTVKYAYSNTTSPTTYTLTMNSSGSTYTLMSYRNGYLSYRVTGTTNMGQKSFDSSAYRFIYCGCNGSWEVDNTGYNFKVANLSSYCSVIWTFSGEICDTENCYEIYQQHEYTANGSWQVSSIALGDTSMADITGTVSGYYPTANGVTAIYKAQSVRKEI